MKKTLRFLLNCFLIAIIPIAVAIISGLILDSCNQKESKTPTETEKVEVIDTSVLRKVFAASYRVPDEIDSTSLAARRNRDLFYHTCADGYADQTFGSEGVAALVNVVALKLQGANIKSWWIGGYYYKWVNGVRWKFWFQWGYAVDAGGLFQAFYVYSISPIFGQWWPLVIINQDNSVPLEYGTKVKFEVKRNLNMEEVPTDTYWSFLRNGRKVFDIDLGVTSLDGKLQSCTESWGTTSFSNIIHVDYLDMYRNGAWSHLPSGNIGSISWRIEGSRSRPEFIQSEHEFGGRYQTPISYLLW